MGDIYLRIEAVNLSNCVYDTNDISTIRGGGYLVLDVVNKLEQLEIDGKAVLEKISTGASTGLFKVLGYGAEEAENRVRDHLKEKTQGHATFVVNTFEHDGDISFSQLVQHLTAKNRFSQFQELTVPWGTGWDGGEKPCPIDWVRPALEYDPAPDGSPQKVSKSVEFRKSEGRILRNMIYPEALDEEVGYAFTNNLNELTKDEVKKSLNGKMAFIHLDGNKFTKIIQEYCSEKIVGREFGKQLKALKNFDKTLQDEFRKPFLKKLIDEMNQTKRKTSSDQIRLETLLWGGDEVEWVVPAWEGLKVLELFYGFNPPPNLKYDPSQFNGPPPTDIPLTHAAGVVFCHHTAPILQIRSLAKRLADKAKEPIKDIPRSRPEGDVFHYLVLESYDMLEGDLDSFVKKFYRPADFSSLLMKGADLESFSANLKIVTTWFPHNKVYEIIDKLRKEQDYASVYQEGLKSCPPVMRDQVAEAVENIIGSDPRKYAPRWFVIADLWDFVA